MGLPPENGDADAGGGGAGVGGDDLGRIKVFLRLRPMNKLEMSTRSKDCIELDDDPKLVTIDAPLQGEHSFECDMVFDEYASQLEVCHEVASGIPRRLLEGINCSLVAFGQTGTGKTHTMLGEGNGTEVNALSKSLSNMAKVMAGPNSLSSSFSNLPVNMGGSSSNLNINLDDDVPELTEEEAMRTAGVIPKLVANIFDELRSASATPSVEYTIRVSFVEFYLEQIRDLLQPQADTVRIGKDEHGDACVLGASELCCVTPADVYALLARGTAHRTQSATITNADSSRSHAVVTIRVEQLDRETGRQCTARLQLFDLAGSEMIGQDPAVPIPAEETENMEHNESGDKAPIVECKMVNQSLVCFSNMVRAELLQQEQRRNRKRPSMSILESPQPQEPNDGEESLTSKPMPRLVHPNKFAKASKLAKLLQPCFGGNSCTRLICTASPSSHNIDETLNTIRFARRVQKLENNPIRQERLAIHEYRKRLAQSDRRVDGLSELTKALALECYRIQKHQIRSSLTPQSKDQDESSSSSDSSDSSESAAENDTTKENDSKMPLTPSTGERNPRLWEIIEQVVSETESGKENNTADLSIHVVRKGNPLGDSTSRTVNADQQDARIELLESQVKEANLAREKAEASLRDIQSEVLSLRSQTELMSRVKHKMERDLNDAKSEIRVLSTRKAEVEHNLRTSQFRESEAVGFLRQFRSFYIRLLKNKAAHGNGDASQLAEEVISKIPGVPELEDLFDIDSLMMASGLIEEDEIGEDVNTSEYLPSKEALSRSASEALQAEQREIELARTIEKQGMSIASRQEPVQHTTYRQKLVQTPAGLLAMKKEKEMERNLAELSSKNVSLQNAVNAEKAMVEAMSARQGALNKMKATQELTLMRQELERKTNDLQAIVWKMNEVHLVNKIVEERVEDREIHAAYLEEHLVDLQTKNRRLVMERQDAERKLRDESSFLRKQLEGLSRSLWQLGERSSKQLSSSRILVPFNADGGSETDIGDLHLVQRRKSLGELAEEMLAPEIPILITSSTQTDFMEKVTTGMQTEEVEDPEVETPPPPEEEKEEEEEEKEVEEKEEKTTELVESGTQTDEEEEEKEPLPLQLPEIPPPKEMTTVETQTEVPETNDGVEISTQTEENDGEKRDAEMQTEGDDTVDGGEETEKERAPKESTDMNTQTDEASRMHSESIEISTQTTEEFKPKVEMSDMITQTVPTETESTDAAIQTEESIPPQVESAIAEVQTDPLIELEPKEVITISTQTDARRKFEIGTQTILDSSSIRTAIIAPSAEAMTQTDVIESRLTGAMDSMDRGIQTELEYAPPTTLCYDAATQTNEFPDVIAIGGGRSEESTSLEDPVVAAPTRNKSTASSGTMRGGGWNAESSQGSFEFHFDSGFGETAAGDRWKTPASSNEKKAFGYDDNQFASSFTGINSIKEKFQGGTAVNGHGGARFGASPSTAFAMDSPKSADKTDPRPAEASSTPAVPEWMSKRRQMGLENTKSEEGLGFGQGGRPVTSNPRPSIRQSHSGELQPIAPSVSASAGTSTKPEWMQRLKQNSAKFETNHAHKGISSPPPKPQNQIVSPEWMQKVKKIQAKEHYSAAAPTMGGTPLHPPAPVAASAHVAASTSHASADTPEWMKKFQQMGLKEVDGSASSSSIYKGGKPADYEPRRFVDKFGNAVIPGVTHDEAELERMRKEEKKARKREKKAKKKAQKEMEQQGAHNL